MPIFRSQPDERLRQCGSAQRRDRAMSDLHQVKAQRESTSRRAREAGVQPLRDAKERDTYAVSDVESASEIE
eukprot:3133330-Pyramimonas_sp.AAC.1